MEIPEGKKILFGVLDWGLGHATRSVPLIKKLAKNNDVILASAGRALDFLTDYFPALPCIEKPKYGIEYASTRSAFFSIVLQSLKINKAINAEHRWLENYIQKEKIEAVYSDNCYGLYNHTIVSTIITHQLMLKMPAKLKWIESFAHKWVLKKIDCFDYCLVPDFDDLDNLSGDLSHLFPIPEHVEFIGPQSRFEYPASVSKTEKQYDVVALISGPEPARSSFELELKNKLLGTEQKVAIIRGIPGSTKMNIEKNLDIYDHLNDSELISILLNSKKIICRAGYSTIMDLNVLKRLAEFIPTPGQTEQEYLAEYHSSKRNQ